MSAIADAKGHRNVLRYERTGVERGWHRIEARLCVVKSDVYVRRGY